MELLLMEMKQLMFGIMKLIYYNFNNPGFNYKLDIFLKVIMGDLKLLL